MMDGNTGLVDEVIKGSTLPRAGEMGGTHAKKDRKPRGKIEVG
jgi:hypothetical protein